MFGHDGIAVQQCGDELFLRSSGPARGGSPQRDNCHHIENDESNQNTKSHGAARCARSLKHNDCTTGTGQARVHINQIRSHVGRGQLCGGGRVRLSGWRRLMPLKHLNEAYAIELDGIGFGMVDEQWRKLRCLVTGAAITDAIGGNPTQAEQVEWFLANRSLVDRAITVKFDHRTFENDGSIRVCTRELNPHLFAF